MRKFNTSFRSNTSTEFYRMISSSHLDTSPHAVIQPLSSFHDGWWSWFVRFVYVAIYPALFVEYLKFWYPAMTSGARWLLVVAFVVGLTALNVLGVRPVGRLAVALAVGVLIPMAALI